jgi:hypothetical protein
MDDEAVTIQIIIDKELSEKLCRIAKLSGAVSPEQVASILLALYISTSN